MQSEKLYNNLLNNNSKIFQPDGLHVFLMEHQKTAVYAMLDLEKTQNVTIENCTAYTGAPKKLNINTNIGILGDKIGSGKSYMIIALLLNDSKPAYNPSLNNAISKYINVKIVEKDNYYIKLKSNLLIVPHKLVSQWETFLTYAPSINSCLYNDKMDINTVTSDIYDVIMIPCVLVDKFITKVNVLLNKPVWNRIIIDEIDSIKLPKTIPLLFNFMWLMTGTPNGIVYNNKIVLGSLIGANWVIDYITVKNNKEFVEESLKLPIPKRIIHKCHTPNEIRIVKDFIPKNIINMINAGNSDGAIKLLNYNENTSNNIIKIVTANIQRAIETKEQELETANKNITKYKKNIGKQEELHKKIEQLTRIITRLQQKYKDIETKISSYNESMCPICMDDLSKPTVINCCKTVYCFDCLMVTSASNNLCPHCRKYINKNNIHILGDNSKSHNTTLRNKIDILLEIIIKNPKGKILVFSDYNETFNKIEGILDARNISYSNLKGTGAQINKILINFGEGDIRVLLLNASNFGAGMNIQSATDVIIYHRFTKETEDQIIGRAHRFGRDINNTVNVHYLVHENENIRDLETNVTKVDKYDDITYLTYLENLQ